MNIGKSYTKKVIMQLFYINTYKNMEIKIFLIGVNIIIKFYVRKYL